MDQQYTSIEEIDKDINQLRRLRKQIANNGKDPKFILIISPEIDKYLDWVALERRMHKSQVVRTAVENVIIKDKKYQQFLTDNF